jgi:hypothetical protein
VCVYRYIDRWLQEMYRGDESVEWMLDYNRNSSVLEYEAAMALPQLRAERRRMTKEERRELTGKLRKEGEEEILEQPLVLVLQQQRTATGVTDGSALRVKSLRAAETMPSAHVLTNFAPITPDRPPGDRGSEVEAEEALVDAAGRVTEEFRDSELRRFVSTALTGYIEEHMSPIKGPLRALTSNIKIDEYKQALFLKSRALQAAGGQLSHGRLGLLRELTAYCNGQSFTRPLVVVAAAGGGKTALLSLFLAYYLDSTAPFAGKACPSHRISPLSSKHSAFGSTKGDRHKARVCVQTHFTCAAASGTNPERMLRRFCARLASHFHLDPPGEVPQDYDSLCKKLREYCSKAASSFRGDMTLIVVDGIDELNPEFVNTDETRRVGAFSKFVLKRPAPRSSLTESPASPSSSRAQSKGASPLSSPANSRRHPPLNSRGRSMLSPTWSGGGGGAGSGGCGWRGEAAVAWMPELLNGGGPASAEEIGDGRAKSISFPVRCICSVKAEEDDLFRGRGVSGGGGRRYGGGGGGGGGAGGAGGNVARFSTASSGGTDSWVLGGLGRGGTGGGCPTGGGWEEGRIGGGVEGVGGGGEGSVLEALRLRKAAPYELIIPPIPAQDRSAVLLSLLSSTWQILKSQYLVTLYCQCTRALTF